MDGNQSAFDMSFSTLGRINFNLWHCNESRRDNNIDNWWKSLVNIYTEVIIYVKKEKKREYHKEEYNKLNKEYKQFLIYQNNYHIASKQKVQAPYNPPVDIFNEFLNWEIELRTAMDEAGLLLKRGEDAYGAMV